MKTIKINESQIYSLVEEISNKLNILTESEENIDLIKESLESVFINYKKYKLNNSANAEEKALLNEMESLFSQYDML